MLCNSMENIYDILLIEKNRLKSYYDCYNSSNIKCVCVQRLGKDTEK